MKHQKELLARPWPENTPALPEAADWLVETARFRHRGRVVLEVRFSYNRAPAAWNQDRQDFRVFLAHAAGEFTVQYRGGVRYCDLTAAMRRGDCWSAPRTCYPWIGPEDEARIARTLGARETGNHQLDNLDRWMAEQVARRAAEQRARAGYLPDEWVSKCPEELPEGVLDFIRRTVLPEDSTLVYKRGNVRGTCFRCGRQVRVSAGGRFRQDRDVTCPDCGAQVLCVLEGGSAWKAGFVANLAFCQKGTDGETVFIRHFHLRRDPSARFEHPEDWLEECARYALRGNQAAMWLHEAKERSGWSGLSPCIRYRLPDWRRSRKFYIYDGPYYFMAAGAAEAFAGTRLQYCRLEEYLSHTHRGAISPIRYLCEFTRYPVLEFLWKAGYHRVVDEKIRGLDRGCRNCLRWQRPAVREAFPFPLRLLKLKPPGAWTAENFQRVRDLLDIAPLTDREVGLLLEEPVELELLRAALPRMTVRQLFKYRRRQGEDAFAAFYPDYLRECAALGLDLTDRAVLFPQNLANAHQRTAAMAEYEAKQEEIAAFARRAEQLAAWNWARDGLLIRPAASMAELKREGRALHHCVAGYASNMAKGETAIFLVRRAAAPETPWYTLELRDKRIVQCRTDHNVSAEARDPAVWQFVTDWFTQVVNGPQRREKAAGQGNRREL